jgi:hypothetical protein
MKLNERKGFEMRTHSLGVLTVVALSAIFGVAGRALAVNPLGPYGQNQGESHVNEDHQGQSLVGDNMSGGDVNGCNFGYADLTNANLSDASHYNCDFSHAILRGADLAGGYGVQALFVDADCTGANLSASDSYWDDFTGANLTDATLDTYLVGVPFAGANLNGADFTGAYLYTTNFADTDLSGANLSGADGLDQAIFGPTYYNLATSFPAGFDPSEYGLILVPEPSALALLAAGAIGLVGYAWRRRASRTAAKPAAHDISKVTTSSTVSIRGIILGVVLMFLGVGAFTAVWIRKTHVGGYVFTLVCLVGGPVFVLGARRNLITAATRDTTYRWMSGPLAYKSTVEICAKTAESCRRNRVSCTSHVTEVQ